jgi:hypothetical protein
MWMTAEDKRSRNLQPACFLVLVLLLAVGLRWGGEDDDEDD